MTATPVPDRWNNFLHLEPYRRGNSPVGIVIASRRSGTRRAIDIDLQITRDRNFIGTHWGHPKHERFRNEFGDVPYLPFRLMSTRGACRLRTLEGDRISTATYLIACAALEDVRVELDLKAVPSRAAMRRLAAACAAYYGPNWQQRVQVKAAHRRGLGWRRILRRAHAAGFTTFLIRFNGDPGNLPAYVDHYRTGGPK